MKSRDKAFDSKYDSYVEHPRFGHRPRYTGLDPNPYDFHVNLHSNATNIHEIQKRYGNIFGENNKFFDNLIRTTPKEPPRIAGTAIKADTSKQKHPTVPVTHYYDVERVCRSCNRPFIFFAEEQKHWYETLGFSLDSDCVRCPECRKTAQFLARNRATYEKLATAVDRNWKDNVKMAASALTLVEHGVFQNRVLQKVRALLKKVPDTERESKEYLELIARVKKLAAENC